MFDVSEEAKIFLERWIIEDPISSDLYLIYRFVSSEIHSSSIVSFCPPNHIVRHLRDRIKNVTSYKSGDEINYFKALIDDLISGNDRYLELNSLIQNGIWNT